MYRRLNLDLIRLSLLVTRGLSDRAIGRVLGCHRETVLNYRHRLNIPTCWPIRRSQHGMHRRRHAELDRLWGRLSIDQKTALLLQRPEESCQRPVASRQQAIR